MYVSNAIMMEHYETFIDRFECYTQRGLLGQVSGGSLVCVAQRTMGGEDEE